MKRHIALLVCILLIVTMAFVACGKGDVDETTGETSGENINTHQHTFGDVWSMDETNHWHAATCTDGEDCTSAKVSVTAHTDADKNSVCDTCGYDYGHAHTYATELSSDETGHWYAVTCECSIDVKDKASHADANNDGTCDVCAYNGGHEHTYVTDAWATDADNHWHAASCGHSVIEDSEAHDFDDMGLCEVCGYLKGETIAVDKAVEMGEFYASLVNGGNIFFERDEWGSKTQESIDFVLGNGNANWSVKDLTYGGQTNYYYSLYKNTIFGVVESVNEDGSVNLEKAYEPSSALVNGYLFANVFGWDGAEEDAYYGTTNLVVGLYEAAKKSATLEECIIIADGKNVYTFSFTRPVIDWEGNASLYVISVSFTLSDEYTYETVSVSSAKYAAAADDETAENVTYHTTTLLPTTVYNYNVTQTVGERTQTPKYEAEKVLMTDFKLVDANGNEINQGRGRFLPELYGCSRISRVCKSCTGFYRV